MSRTAPLLLALAAIAAPALARDAGRDTFVDLDAASNDQRLALDIGDRLRVRLSANPSTGADWQRRDAFGGVLASEPCPPRVRPPLVSRDPDVPAPPVGESVEVQYCFRAVAAGEAYLYLYYGRAWTPGAPAWDHFNLAVDVAPAD